MPRPDARRLDDLVSACRGLIADRFPADEENGAAAVLLDDGTVLTGTSPEAVNPRVQLCHEVEPILAAHRLGRRITASVCLHHTADDRHLVLSPCGVCREQLAVHGPDTLVAVADPADVQRVVWKELREVLPDYWVTAFPDEVDPGWLDPAAG